MREIWRLRPWFERISSEQVDTAALLARVDAWIALIGDIAATDPRRECSARQVAPAQEQVRGWLEDQPADLVDWWDGL